MLRCLYPGRRPCRTSFLQGFLCAGLVQSVVWFRSQFGALSLYSSLGRYVVRRLRSLYVFKTCCKTFYVVPAEPLPLFHSYSLRGLDALIRLYATV